MYSPSSTWVEALVSVEQLEHMGQITIYIYSYLTISLYLVMKNEDSLF